MWSISEKLKFWILISTFLLSSCALQNKWTKDHRTNFDEQRKIVLAIDSLLKAHHYVKAEHYGRLFLQHYPRSVYLDDVAYRLAYLHVIADERNPFFDYQQARTLFAEFLKKFPESQYALACNNWLKVLYLESRLQKQNADLKRKVRLLQQALEKKSDEITRLRGTLKDLENVIKR